MKLKVLIVGNSEKDVLQFVSLIEKGSNYLEYRHVLTYNEMRTALMQETWNIVLANYSKNPFTGLDALTLLKKLNVVIPCIIISDSNEEDVIVKSIKAGADNCIIKTNLTRLLPAIKQALNKPATTHKQLENNQNNSDHQYRLLFEKSVDGILIADIETKKFKYANPAICQMLGYSEEDLISKSVSDIHPKKDLPHVIAEFESQVGGKKNLAQDIPCLKKDGSIIYADVNMTKIFLEDRLYGVGSFRDTTKRRKAEEALRDSELRFKQVSENAQESIWEIDKNGLYTYISPYIKELLGYEIDEIIGIKHFYDLFDPENREELKQAAFKIFDRKENYRNFINTNIHKDGRKITLSTSGVPIMDNNKNLIGYRGVDVDITAQLEAEELLKSKEEQYRLLFENAPIGISISDMDGKLIAYNNAILKPGGYTRSDIIKIANAGKLYYKPSDREVILSILKDKGIVNNYPVQLKRKDGSPYDALLSLSIIQVNTQPRIQALIEDVTERKQAEKELQESEQRYRILFEKSVDGIIILDVETKVCQYANPALCQMLMYSEKELKKLELKDLHPKQNLPYIFKEFESLITDNKSLALNIPCLKKDGTIMYADITAANVIIDGKPCALGLFRDTSERKQAEIDLRESEKRYRQLVNAASEGILVVQDKLLKFVNPMVENITGYSREELLTIPFIKHIHPEDRELVEHNYLRRINGEKDIPSYEIRLLRKDGDIRWLEMSGVKIDWHGKAAIQKIMTDITERKQAEEALYKERSLLRLLIDNVPDLMYTKDMDCRKTLVNAAEVENMGVNSEAEVLGKNDFAFYPKEMAEEFYADDISVIQSDQPIINKEEHTVNKFGHKKWILTSKFPLKNERGRIIGLAGIGRDITNRKLAQEEIKNKNTQLKKLNAEKDRFFSIIAHDLKSPFNAILGLSKLLSTRIEKNEIKDTKKITDAIIHSSELAVNLLNDLMSWSRAQTGRMEFKPIKLNVDNLINETILFFNNIASQKSICITKQGLDRISAYADKNMISTVLRNLISNAIKFTFTNGVIIVSVQKVDQEVIVSIQDNGSGISSDAIHNLFKIDSNYSTPGTQNEKGTGLGLILCKEFIDKHNGRIWVESKEGHGSTFHFTIPAAN